MENELVKEGIKIEEIQSLCDVHASVFKGFIEEIYNEGMHRKKYQVIPLIPCLEQIEK